MFLQVMAVDQESGDLASARVVVDVLAEGQLGMGTLPHTADFTFGLRKKPKKTLLRLSSLQRAGGGAQHQLHRGESVVPLHRLPDCCWVRRLHGDVAEKEAEGEEGPAGEGLRGAGQTPECGEKLIWIICGILRLCSRC